MKPETITNYSNVLESIRTSAIYRTVEQFSKEYKIDIKLISFLVHNKYLAESLSKDRTYIAIYTQGDIHNILEQFIMYRTEVDAKVVRDKKDLAYYQANKEFLVDTRKTNSAPVLRKNNPEVNRLIIEIVPYIELALKLNKKDIPAFVIALLNTE